MAIKIEKISNALVITDTTAVKVIAECPSRLVYYDVDMLEENDTIRITNIDANMGEVVHLNFADYPISANVVDSGNAAYTISSWKAFARAGLGS